MTQLEKVIRQVSDLRDFYLRIKRVKGASDRNTGMVRNAATVSEKETVRQEESCRAASSRELLQEMQQLQATNNIHIMHLSRPKRGTNHG